MKRSFRRSRPEGRGSRLSVQRLESRKLMAADIGLIDTTLSIQGSPMDDVAEVYVDADRVIVNISTYDPSGQLLNERGEEFSIEQVGRIVFEGSAGDDVFINDSSIAAVARGGAGNDTLMGGSGNDLLVGGVGDDLILGGGGDDLVLAGPGENVTIVPLGDDAQDGDALSNGDGEQPSEVSGLDDATTSEASDENLPSDDLSLSENVVAPQTNDAVGQDPGDDEPTTCPPMDAAETLEIVEPSDQADSWVAGPNQVVDDVDELASTADPLSEPQTPVTETVMIATDTPVPVETTETLDVESSQSIGLEIVEPISTPDPSTPDPSSLGFNASDPPASAPADNAGDELGSIDEELETDNDVIFGGSGDDWLFGEAGNDTIFGHLSPLDDELLRCVIAGRLRL